MSGEAARATVRDGQRSSSGHSALSGGRSGRGPPASTGYRLQKFVRRYKGQAIAASVVLLTLIAGVIGTSVGMYRANRPTRSWRTRTPSWLKSKRKCKRGSSWPSKRSLRFTPGLARMPCSRTSNSRNANETAKERQGSMATWRNCWRGRLIRSREKLLADGYFQLVT